MHLKFRNVEEAFQSLVSWIHSGQISTHTIASRNGEVAMIEEPVTITYERPTERVLLNPHRDANPFFHLYESLWMLAGRNDVAPLKYYNSRIAQYSDDGQTFNGAYGYRWRKYAYDPYADYGERTEGTDQLTALIDHLRRKPESRRAVLQMWNVGDDLLQIDNSKDVCCNLSVCFSVEQGVCRECNGAGTVPNLIVGDAGYYGECVCPKCNASPHDQPQFLNMTVFNRSNDMILGMLGANAVHFSILQEYVALALGLQVGKYNQITNNLHIYTSNWKPEVWMKPWVNYQDCEMYSVPLVRDLGVFDIECKELVNRHQRDAIANEHYVEPFIQHVAQPMCIAFHHHKRRQYDRALATVRTVADDWWRVAGLTWLQKRADSHANRVGET